MGGVINISRVLGFERNLGSSDNSLIVNGHDAVAVPVAEGNHARNADGIPFAGILDAVLYVQGVVCRSAQGLSSRNFHAFSCHDQAVAADVLDAYRSANAYFGVRVFRAVGSLRAGSGIGSQLDRGAFHLALLSQQDDGVVLQCIDAHSTGQRKGAGRLFLRRALGAYLISQNAGLLFDLLFGSLIRLALRSAAFRAAGAGISTAAAALSVARSVTAAFRVTVSASAAFRTSPRSGTSVFPLFFFRGRRVFAHAGRSVQRNRAAALDLGSLCPIAVHQYRSVVLHIADQDRCADLHLGVGQRILHGKLQAVLCFSRSSHHGPGIHIDRTVHRLRTFHGGSVYDNVLPNGHIGVVCIGDDTYAGAKAKGRGLLCIVAACIGAFHLVLDVLDASFAITARGVLRLAVGGVHGRILEHLGGIDGFLFALFLVLGFLRIRFVALCIGVRIVLLLICPG